MHKRPKVRGQDPVFEVGKVKTIKTSVDIYPITVNSYPSLNRGIFQGILQINSKYPKDK